MPLSVCIGGQGTNRWLMEVDGGLDPNTDKVTKIWCSSPLVIDLIIKFLQPSPHPTCKVIQPLRLGVSSHYWFSRVVEGLYELIWTKGESQLCCKVQLSSSKVLWFALKGEGHEGRSNRRYVMAHEMLKYLSRRHRHNPTVAGPIKGFALARRRSSQPCSGARSVYRSHGSCKACRDPLRSLLPMYHPPAEFAFARTTFRAIVGGSTIVCRKCGNRFKYLWLEFLSVNRRQTQRLIGLIMPWLCDIGTDSSEYSYDAETDTPSEESDDSEVSLGHIGVHVQNSLRAPDANTGGRIRMQNSNRLPAASDSQRTTQHMGSQMVDIQRYACFQVDDQLAEVEEEWNTGGVIRNSECCHTFANHEQRAWLLCADLSPASRTFWEKHEIKGDKRADLFIQVLAGTLYEGEDEGDMSRWQEIQRHITGHQTSFKYYSMVCADYNGFMMMCRYCTMFVKAWCRRKRKIDDELDVQRAYFQDFLGIGASSSLKRRRINE